MNLLNLPEEVIEGHILPLLKWNDLLRFRRVCKTTRDITTAYMRVHPELAPELEVNLEEESFKAFLEMGIPTIKLFLKNNESGFKFYDENRGSIWDFIAKYGHLVKHLRMVRLPSYLCDNEMKFVHALTNLEGLEASTFFNCNNEDDQMADQTTLEDLLGPKTEKNGLEAIVRFDQFGDWSFHIIAYLVACQKLDRALLYASSNVRLSPVEMENLRQWVRHPNNIMRVAFLTFHLGIQKSLQTYQKVSFSSIDFVGYHDNPKKKQKLLERRGALWFLHLCMSCLENGVKLKNVGSNWFNGRGHPRAPPGANARELGNVVVSMVNVKPGVFPLEMNNLERIDIRATSRCDTRLGPGQNRPVWPRLKILQIWVDSKVIFMPEGVGLPNRRVVDLASSLKAKQLFGFFFKNVCRAGLMELELKFQEDWEYLGVPETQDIVNACPNLKKLRIVNWPGTNKELVKLWNGLEGLEEVSLENCKHVGNVAFVGKDRENPAFLKLKNLKKLSLKDLDQMPKITDTLFSLVICHLKLTHFTVTSNGPIKSVTLIGIKSLLSGQFAKSVEKFPFGQWSLEGVSMEQLNELNQKFRSSKML